MTNKYDIVMKSKPDEALVKIVFLERDLYDSDAVRSADAELKSRNLPEAFIDDIQNGWKQQEKLKIRKSVEPLGTGVKIWVFIFPVLLNFIFAFIYKADGYDRKTKDVWKWTVYGLCFYFGLFLLMLLLARIYV
jgi:uncharacterized membrane protein YagU involved in acid resistance